MGVAIPQVITEDRVSGAQVIDGGVFFPDYDKPHLLWFKPTSAGNGTNFTVSLWFRKEDPKSIGQQPIWTASPDTDSNSYYGLYIGGNELRWHNGNASNVQINGTKVLRDNTWYHIHSKVFVQDSINYVQVYVNGKKWGHYQTASASWWNNTSYRMDIGSSAYPTIADGASNSFTQVYHIDGQSLEPESFGYMDPVTKLWKPKSFDPVNDGGVYCASSGPQVTSNHTIQNDGANLFSSSDGTRVYVTGTDPYILYTPDKPIRFKHSLKARTDTNSAGGATVQWVLNGDTIVPNLDRVAAATSPRQYTTIADGPGELRSLKLRVTGGSNGSGQSATFNAIKIDDIQLINSDHGFGTNGFYLPMDGKSSLTKDMSPNGNDFKSEGLRSNTTLDRATGAIPILKTSNGGGFGSSGLRSIHETFNVTVVSTGEGNKYFLNGVKVNSLPLYRGGVYKFDQSDASNGTGGTHPLRFATAADAAGSTEYTDGVTQNGTPGTAGAYTLIVVPHNAPDTLYYYCTNHGGMGGPTANTTDILKADPYAWKCVLALPMNNTAGSQSDERDYSGYLRGVARKEVTHGGSLDTNSQYSNFYGKSAVFDGSFHQTVADHTDFHLSNNDWTIEMWMRPTSSGFTYAAGQTNAGFSVANTAWYIDGSDSNGDPKLVAQFTDGTNWYPLVQGYPTVNGENLSGQKNEWNHVALTRKGFKHSMWINGNLAGYQNYNYTMVDSPNNLSVGRAGEHTSSVFQGHMCDFRMYNGVAKYEEEFTVPSQNALTVNRDTPQGLPYGSQKKVTSGSYNTGFGGKGFVVYPPSSDLEFAGDFTFEMYVNSTKSHINGSIMCVPLQIGNYSGPGMAIWGHPHFQLTINGNNKQDQALYTGDNTQYYTANMQKNGWVHVAMTRSGTTVRCFLDGQIVQSFTESGTVGSSTLRNFVGTYSGDGIAPVTGASGQNQNWTGNLKITDVHLVNGTCLYTTNFISPTEPIQPVANTKLLCMNRFDNITQCIRGTVEPNYTTTTAYAMWPLNSDINDVSGNNRTLTENNGSTTFVSLSGDNNPFGLTNAAYFNVNNKYLSYAVSPATEYSIDFYIKPTYTTGNSYIAGWNGTDGTDQTIGSNNSPSEAAAQTGVPFNGSGATWSVWGSANMYTREPIVLNQWVHIRFCKTNTENHNFYLNGRLIGSAASDQGAVSPLTFGDCQNGRFAGYIAGIRYVEKDLGAPDPDNLPVTTNGTLPVSGLVPKPSYGVVHNDGEKPKFMACLNSDNPYSDNINKVLAPSTSHAMLISNTAGINDDGTTIKGLGGSSWDNIDSNIAVSSGKWYWEVNPIDVIQNMVIGVGKIDSYNGGANDIYPGGSNNGSSVGLQQNGNLRWDGTQTAEFLYGVEAYNENASLQFGEGNIIGVCLDLDAGRVYWHVDGKFAAGATPGDKGGCTPFNITGGYWRPVIGINRNGASVTKVNFGQRPFAYPPPEGYKTLCRTNIRPNAVAANPKDHFKVLLSPGTGITQSSATELAGVFSRYLYGSDETFYQKGGVPEQEFINTSYLAHQAFNGNTGNGANFGTGAVAANWGYFLPEPGIDGITSMRIWTVNVSELRVNGETVTSSTTNGSWYTISNPPSTLTEIAVKGNSGVTPQINAIEINGKVLRDISILQLCKDTFPKGLWWMKSRFTESAESYDQHMLMNNTTGNNMSGRPWYGTAGVTDGYRTYTAPTNECVAYCWSAPEAWTGTTNYVASSGYRNTAAGFSMWQYTGNGVRGNTTSHGLSQRPDFIIIQRTDNNAYSHVYHAHQSVPGGGSNTPDAATYPNIDYAVTFDSGDNYGADAALWGSTAPSDTLVTLGETVKCNASGGTFQAYAWHEVEGYSRFGRYMGLQSSQSPAETENGNFVWCGFRPSAVWIKGIGQGEGWVFRDGMRSPDNPNFKQLNQSLAQESTSTFPIDFYSDGFKIRTSDGTMNYTSSGAYIFAAWAEACACPIFGPTPNAK